MMNLLEHSVGLSDDEIWVRGFYEDIKGRRLVLHSIVDNVFSFIEIDKPDKEEYLTVTRNSINAMRLQLLNGRYCV